MSKPSTIIALDLSTRAEAEAFLDRWEGQEKPFIKIGYQLFYQVGPDWVRDRSTEGYDIFLDLKLHDIPHTVARGIESISQLGVQLVTLHAAGGSEMMQAAQEAARQQRGPKLLAVTQLTSTHQAMYSKELGLPGTVEEGVLRYAHLAHKAGMDGVIASGQEAHLIRQAMDDSFLIVTPGIRPASAAKQDQKRVVTPTQAIRNGANYLVVGRPILQSKDPVASYQAIQQEIQQARRD